MVELTDEINKLLKAYVVTLDDEVSVSDLLARVQKFLFAVDQQKFNFTRPEVIELLTKSGHIVPLKVTGTVYARQSYWQDRVLWRGNATPINMLGEAITVSKELYVPSNLAFCRKE